MLNALITGGVALAPPTNVHLTSNPSPPNVCGSGLFTTFTISFDADPVNHTYCWLVEYGIAGNFAYAAPGATSILVGNSSFSCPGPSVTGFAMRVNSPSQTGWPRSSIVQAPETIVVPT